MKKSKYNRKSGEMEIRILRDGRIIFVAPNDDLIGVAENIDPDNPELRKRKRNNKHDRNRNA